MSENIATVGDSLRVLDTRKFCEVREHKELFTAEECDRIISLWDDSESQESKIWTEGKSKINPLRKGKIQWLKPWDEKVGWITERLLPSLWELNDLQYGFNLDGFTNYFQLTKYDGGDGYGQHIDIGDGLSRKRKLSFTVQLSNGDDYQGGDLEFDMFPKACKDKGSITVFPSFFSHSVSTIRQGQRWALVGWVSGPDWR